MDNHPLLSVIVPVYKVEAYLDRCVESIVSQTYKNLEIILVDDGSPDNCPAKCDVWAAKDNRIKVIHKQNGGLSDARNAGMAIVTGEFIAFVDSDDWLNTDMYSILMDAIKKTTADAAGCSFLRTDGENIPEAANCKPEIKVFGNEEIMSELISDRIIKQVVWNKVYRANKIKNVLFEIGKYHEDEFWAYLALSKCVKYAAVDYLGYYYFQRTDSIMGAGYSLKRLDAIEAKTLRLDYIMLHYPVLERKATLNLLETCIYHGQLALSTLNKNDKKEAILFLRHIVERCCLTRQDIIDMPISRKIWICFARINFIACCKLKNLLRKGL